MKVCGQYGTYKRVCCLGTSIFIPTVAKLFTNVGSIRNNLQKSDLSWCWRDLVTVKDLRGLTHWFWKEQPIACCNPHQSHNCSTIIRSQIDPPIAMSHICSQFSHTNAVPLLPINYRYLTFRKVLEFNWTQILRLIGHGCSYRETDTIMTFFLGGGGFQPL